MQNIQALLFDVDGTLLDTNEFICQAFEHAIASHGYPPLDRQELNKIIGIHLEECYTRLTGCTDPTTLVEAHRVFQENNLHLSTPFENTITTLQKLKEKKLKLAVITTRSKRTSIETLRQAGIADFFDIILSREDVTNPKPHPEALLKVLQTLNITPEQAIMIGDTEFDVVAGKNAGTHTIGVTYGFHGERIKDHNPDFVVDDIADILKILL